VSRLPLTARAHHLAPFKFLSVGRTHVGCVRTLNEDALLNKPEIGLWAVADGMGGHAHGDIASKIVVDGLAGVQDFSSADSFQNAARNRINAANDNLVQRAAQAGVMGATIVNLLVHQDRFSCLWAGDSRAYLYRSGVLRRLTRDHTVVQEMVDAGVLSAREAKGHPKAHVITRAVGAHAPLQLDMISGSLQAGDRFLLCSDGLTAVLSEQTIADGMLRAPLEAAAERMLQQAISAGAPDNVTLVLVAVERA
jgi:serine/threonine protein phosphatase PrpC